MRWPIAVGSVLLTLTAVTGCSATSAERPGAVPNPSAGPKDTAHWALPLNRYLPPKWDVVERGVAVLTKRCMDATQYEWPLGPMSIDPPIGESWNSVGRKLFSPSLAARYGYGNSEEFVLSAKERAAAREEASFDFDDAGMADLERCRQAARKRLGATHNPFELAERLQFADEFEGDVRARKAAAGRWKRCMKPLGIAKLPDVPDEMSPGLFEDASAPSRTTPPGPAELAEPRPISPREKEVATFDAKCQQSSGYAQASYNAEWNAEMRALNDNANALERERRIADGQRKQALAVIAEYAPQAAL